jgi:TetR/AcrR family transcriptional regulator
MARPATVSPDRILAAAALEFAARGFAGARVDRIARRARINKAMLYYHFKSKQALYRALLRRLFTIAAERLQPIAAGDAPPEQKVAAVIETMARFINEHRSFPSIMLREIAEGGVHLDRDTLAALSVVPRTIAGIVQQGVAAGSFRVVHPIAAYFTMFAPVVVFMAGTPIRQRLADRRLVDMTGLTPEQFIVEHQRSVRHALAVTAPGTQNPALRT